MELKGAVKMTVEYSDGTKTVVNYNPITAEPTDTPFVAEAVEAPAEVVEEVAEESVAEEPVVETASEEA